MLTLRLGSFGTEFAPPCLLLNVRDLNRDFFSLKQWFAIRDAAQTPIESLQFWDDLRAGQSCSPGREKCKKKSKPQARIEAVRDILPNSSTSYYNTQGRRL